MYYEAMEAQQRGRALDFDADAACTFAPAINDRSRTLLATSGELPAAFLQRQQYLAALAAEKKAVYRSLVEGGDCTFSPRLHSRSRSRRGSGSWNSEDWDDATDRLTKLAYQDARHVQAVKEALREHHYAQFTFAPEINPRSRSIGKHHTIEELHGNEKGSRCRARASRAVDERYEEECTFKPALDPHSLALANQRRQMGAPSLLDRLDHDMSVKMRNARLQEAQAQREYEELKECTFTPEVNKGPPPMPEPSVTIPGLSRYAELQELAKRKKEEQQRRQDEVWQKHPKGSTQLFTVPKPFNLETDQREQRPTCYSASNQEASSASNQSHSKVNNRRNHEALKALSIQRILQQNEALGCGYEN
ncbi:hypothetical protein DUNSADRAFT_4827 [Dunaliella salina]|nr:hypothetical protein DUNSADRAFT_4827 [Dunaliella salina]|eukprot:KAF5837104.1 hypothetical protein DUNSADRAFT_4827 [Dunaliella salina]